MFGKKLETTNAAATDAARQKAKSVAEAGILDQLGKIISGAAENQAISAAAIYASGVVGGTAVAASGLAIKALYDYVFKGGNYESKDPYLSQELKDAAVKNCGGNMWAEKRSRRLYRERIIKAGEGSGDEAKKEAAKNLKRDMAAVERARLSLHVYDTTDDSVLENDRPAPPIGFLKPTPEELNNLGLTRDDLAPKGSDFRAEVYKVDDRVNSIPPEYVLAFRGTKTGKDWLENGKQGLGLKSDHYDRSMSIAGALKSSGKSFDITGHSLGGGMASAASIVAGVPATTFNSAGLHENTVARQGKVMDKEEVKKSINAYRVEGADKAEILTSVSKLPLVPDGVGEPRSVSPPDETVSRFNLHSMDSMIDGIEKQKIHDQEVLKRPG